MTIMICPNCKKTALVYDRKLDWIICPYCKWGTSRTSKVIKAERDKRSKEDEECS